MAKDMVKEGLTFALGIVKISGEQFNRVVKGLEKKHKVSSNEGKRMVYAWITQQQKQLEKMQRNLKREVLKTRLYSAKDLEKMNSLIKRLSREITKLQRKKKKAEKTRKKKAVKKGKKRPAKKKAKRKKKR